MEHDASLVTGFDWLLSCTSDFEATIAFVQDVLGLTIARRGPAQTDTHFSRYACANLPGGGTLEIVEPSPSADQLHGKQILCFTVLDLLEAKGEMERRGAVFVGDIFHEGDLGWTYVQAPGGNIYQIYGPLKGSPAQSSG
jgi:catechol 2,3-dioxygenase-like lactoylglutathione lyase family enzyme